MWKDVLDLNSRSKIPDLKKWPDFGLKIAIFNVSFGQRAYDDLKICNLILGIISMCFDKLNLLTKDFRDTLEVSCHFYEVVFNKNVDNL